MAVTAYTGPPGAGKSYALVSQVIVPGVSAGRRVLTNITGVDPERVQAYAGAKKGAKPGGSVVLFDGEDAKKPGFFPTAEKPEGAFVQAGDLIVFDEWRLTFANRGAVGNDDLEPFLRWHRHLVSDQGVATDMVIGTQLVTDIHRDFRGILERSYKFKKLAAVGLSKGYQFQVFEGAEQRKGTAFRTGNGHFKKDIFALYKSYETEGDANEEKTDGRATLFSKGFLVVGVVAVIGLAVGAWGLSQFLSGGTIGSQSPPQSVGGQGVQAQAAQVTPAAPPSSPYRIVGMVTGDGAPLVIVADDQGSTRLEPARNFEFQGDRPISGTVDGMRVIAKDRVYLANDPELVF